MFLKSRLQCERCACSCQSVSKTIYISYWKLFSFARGVQVCVKRCRKFTGQIMLSDIHVSKSITKTGRVKSVKRGLRVKNVNKFQDVAESIKSLPKSDSGPRGLEKSSKTLQNLATQSETCQNCSSVSKSVKIYWTC